MSRKLSPYFISLYRVYRDLGEFEWQRSTIQLLSLYRCVSEETAASLLLQQARGSSSSKLAIMRRRSGDSISSSSSSSLMGTPELQRQTQKEEETEKETDTETETELKPLLREAELQALQRMMQ